MSAPKPDAIAMEDEARERGLAAPFRRLTAQIPEWGMRIQVAPLDTAFPQSVRVSDPEYVRGMLKRACASSRYAAARRIRITAIRYYPGLRHVLRYDLLNRVERASVFAKVYNNGEGRGVYRVTAQAAEWLQTCAKGLTVLPPLAYVPNDFVVLYPLLLGEPLDEQLRNPRHNIGRQLERAGEIVRALHGAPETIARSLKPHSFEAEIAEVVEASRHISVLFPPAGALIKTILDRASALHSLLAQEPPTFTHGDLKLEHFWIAPRRLTLIDFDMARLADPALDIGQFWADLEMACDAHGVQHEQAEKKFLASYAAQAPAERLLRARLYQALELIKISGRRIPIFDCNWAARVQRLISRASTLLPDAPP